MEFDLIYVNGDNNLENLEEGPGYVEGSPHRRGFKRLMFDIGVE